MGNQPPRNAFDSSAWKLISSPHNQILLYESIHNQNVHIEKHHIIHQNRRQFQNEMQLVQKRLNHSTIVSSLFLQEKQSFQSQLCVYNYQAFVYLQRIPLRLCDLKDIAFPHILHLYNQTLKGYCELSKSVGYFPVESDYIGINESGVCKVWAGSRWSDITVKGNTTSEQDMVKSIIECIQEHIDKDSMPRQNPSIRNFVYRKQDKLNFQSAINELYNYVDLTNHGLCPIKLINVQETPQKSNTLERIQFDNQQSSMYHITMRNSRHHQSNYPQSHHQTVSNALSPRFTMRTIERQELATPLATFQRFQSHQQAFQNQPVRHFQHQNYLLPGHTLPDNRSIVSIHNEKRTPFETRAETARMDGRNANMQRVSQNRFQNRQIFPLLDNSSSKQLVTNTSHNLFNRNESIQQFHQPNLNIVVNSSYQPVQSHRRRTNTFDNSTGPVYSYRENTQHSVATNQRFKRQQELNRRPAYSHFIQNNAPPQPAAAVEPQLRQRPRFMSSKINSMETNVGQSIIMKLYYQNIDMPVPSHEQPNTQLNVLKHCQSVQVYEQYPKSFETKTIINESQSNQIKGVPQHLQGHRRFNSSYADQNPVRYSQFSNTIGHSSNHELQRARQKSTFGLMPNSATSSPLEVNRDDGKTPPQFFRQFQAPNNQGSFDSLKSTPKTKNEKKVGFQMQNQEIDRLNTIGKFGRSAQNNQHDSYVQQTRKFPLSQLTY